jgi:hypothetical protein
MREPVVYAVLLLIALGFAYQTWSREDAAAAERGSVVLWEEPTEAFVAARYEARNLAVDIERRETGDDAYLWARVIRSRSTYRRVNPDSVAPTEMVDTSRFVVGRPGHDLVQALTTLRAHRDLGVPAPERLADYGLTDSTANLTIRIGDRERTLLVGGNVYALSDRYTLDPETGRVYVLPGSTIQLFEGAVARLPERRPHAFERSAIGEVVVRAGGREHVMRRAAGAAPGEEVWTPPDAPDQPDQTFANFMNRLRRLWIGDYVPDVDVAGLELVVRAEYLDGRREPLGFLELFRRAGADGEPEYLVRTELTRVPTTTFQMLAEELAADVAQLF